MTDFHITGRKVTISKQPNGSPSKHCVRVYKSTPEDVTVQLRGESFYALVNLYHRLVNNLIHALTEECRNIEPLSPEQDRQDRAVNK